MTRPISGARASSPRNRTRWNRRRRERGDAGSAPVELAVVVPLLVMLLLFVVLCGRLVSAQLDLDAAAHGAARAASIARTPAAAEAAARRTALDTLAARGVTCRQPQVTVDTGGLRPGGVVTVTVACTVPLADLTLLGVPGSRTASATATSPMDRWRSVALGFRNSDVRGASR